MRRRELEEARRKQVDAIQFAQAKRWRTLTEDASRDLRKLWTLERWGRTQSHLPSDPPKIPALHREGNVKEERSHEGKAEILAERFFPGVEVPTNHLPDWREGREVELPMSCRVSTDDVVKALRRMGPNKAPGSNWLSNKLLKACGRRLAEALAVIATGSFTLGSFPARWRHAKVVVLKKPGKTAAQQKMVGAWRPIALLSCVGKILEAIVVPHLPL